GLLPEVPGEEPAGVTLGDEADVVRVRLLRDREATLGRLQPDLRLRRVTEREERPRELISSEHTEDVGLVLGQVDRAVQLAALMALDDPRVVPRRDRVEAEGDRLVEERRELDALVAAQTG